MAKNYGLGRGLSSLIPQKQNNTISEPKKEMNYFGGDVHFAKNEPLKTEPVKNGGVEEIDVSFVVPNPHQPRLHFDAGKLQELADSIKEHGILQPIIVSQSGNQYEIIAGERRFQAAKLAGLQKVPVIVRDVTEQQKLELAILENVQRHDLNPIEEAKSYLKLIDEFDLTQEEVGEKLGKSRPGVANKLRLLTLPLEIQKGLMEGKITEGHAKAIAAIENPEKQRAMYELIVKDNLTVRQTENKAREISVKPHVRNVIVDPTIKVIEDNLASVLGTKVKLTKSGPGGKIVIEYYSEEELNNILGKIKN